MPRCGGLGRSNAFTRGVLLGLSAGSSCVLQASNADTLQQALEIEHECLQGGRVELCHNIELSLRRFWYDGFCYDAGVPMPSQLSRPTRSLKLR